MELTAKSILVVEDHQGFRKFICSYLKEQSNFQVVGEAENGLHAIQEARALQPDLIILDIGLPGANGIEAARHIRKVACKSKIIFLTQESSPELVREAFEVGACGYIVKALAGAELLAAIKAVAAGKQFVSSGLDGIVDCITTDRNLAK